MTMEDKQNQYNEEPVFYCKSCLSLKIRDVPSMENSEFCDECSSTDIGQCSIEEWEEMYINRYGHRYLDSY